MNLSYKLGEKVAAPAKAAHEKASPAMSYPPPGASSGMAYPPAASGSKQEPVMAYPAAAAGPSAAP
ncbi:hypothetical protein EI017_25175 [Escherichia coli]|nr:hypothetical protein [Escherichia coli]